MGPKKPTKGPNGHLPEIQKYPQIAHDMEINILMLEKFVVVVMEEI